MSPEPISTHTRKVILFGSSGQIGSALAQVFENPWPGTWNVSWSDRTDFTSYVLKGLNPSDSYDFVFAGGITNPKIPEATIRFSNLEFPRKIIQETSEFKDVRYLTLGSVMENFPEACLANAYLKSKLDLSAWIQTQSERNRFRHIRLHTVYGGNQPRFLKPYMFLGQIAGALETKSEFKMSSGEQLREYHHTEDIAQSLAGVLKGDWSSGSSPVLEINSGNPLKLRELAESIFTAFGQKQLLKIGAIPRAHGENLDLKFKRSSADLLLSSREPVAGIIDWLKGFPTAPFNC